MMLILFGGYLLRHYAMCALGMAKELIELYKLT